jgi:hypothetical protein
MREGFLCILASSLVDGHEYHVGTIYERTKTVYLHPDVPTHMQVGLRSDARRRGYRVVDDYPPEEITPND